MVQDEAPAPTDVAANVARVRARIALLEARYGRAPGAVTLVGIAKTHPVAAIRAAAGAGVSHIGESYLQEALPKVEALADVALTWHFTGRIQSNKTAAIAARFDWVHGLDRLRVAERLAAQRPAHLPPLNCCIEVNLQGASSKGGVVPDALPGLALAVSRLPRLRLRGLMVLPEPADTLAAQRLPFAELARQLGLLQHGIEGLDTLSMGMSDDMEAAIAEGATFVRIGTALFGSRGT